MGRGEDEAHAALLAVDVTEEVLDEAERLGCDLVVTHHPIVFHALKRFNSADTVPGAATSNARWPKPYAAASRSTPATPTSTALREA